MTDAVYYVYVTFAFETFSLQEWWGGLSYANNAPLQALQTDDSLIQYHNANARRPQWALNHSMHNLLACQVSTRYVGEVERYATARFLHA